jgi:hypothetical protein
LRLVGRSNRRTAIEDDELSNAARLLGSRSLFCAEKPIDLVDLGTVARFGRKGTKR